jgi:hypothetical protein
MGAAQRRSQRRINLGTLIMTDRMKADAAAPVEKPTRTADEQALVDAVASQDEVGLAAAAEGWRGRRHGCG